MTVFELMQVAELHAQYQQPRSFSEIVSIANKLMAMCDCRLPDGTTTRDRNSRFCKFCGRVVNDCI